VRRRRAARDPPRPARIAQNQFLSVTPLLRL
jgi:hypothetical protein